MKIIQLMLNFAMGMFDTLSMTKFNVTEKVVDKYSSEIDYNLLKLEIVKESISLKSKQKVYQSRNGKISLYI